MSKSGLFAHFPSKEDVQLALLDYTTEVAAVHVIRPAMRVTEGLPRLRALVGNLASAGQPRQDSVADARVAARPCSSWTTPKAQSGTRSSPWKHSGGGFLMALVQEVVDLGQLRSNLDVEQLALGAVWHLSELTTPRADSYATRSPMSAPKPRSNRYYVGLCRKRSPLLAATQERNRP